MVKKLSVVRKISTVLAVLVVLLFSLLVLALDTTALVKSTAAEQIGEAETVKQLIRQVKDSISDRHNAHTIEISEKQAASLVGFVQRAIPDIQGNVEITRQESQIQGTLALPVLGQTVYFNVDMQLLPDNKLNVDYVKIGSLHLPGWFAVKLVEYFINGYTDSEIGSKAREQISKVTMQPNVVAVTIAPMDEFLKELNHIRTNLGSHDNDELTELTGYYLRYIAGRELSLAKKPQPFNLYLKHIMARAREQSTPDNVLLHNKASILALAIFIGHHRVANLVGEVQPDSEKALKPAAPALLRNRNDLARHFIISAAIKMVSEQDVSFAVGEFKELMDRSMGGSGYSFVDLAADMAGVELGGLLGDIDTALATQDALAKAPSEDVYMPSIEGLTEGLSKQQFIERYDAVDSKAYLNEVAKIRQRLAAMPLYQR